MPGCGSNDAIDVGFQAVTASIFEVPSGSGDQFAILAGHTDPTTDDKGR